MLIRLSISYTNREALVARLIAGDRRLGRLNNKLAVEADGAATERDELGDAMTGWRRRPVTTDANLLPRPCRLRAKVLIEKTGLFGGVGR